MLRSRIYITLRAAATVNRLATRQRNRALSTQASVFTWGTGTQGQLGHGSFEKTGIRNSYEELFPILLESFEGKSVAKLDFGAAHSAAIDEEGKLYTWGSNEYHQLGHGSSNQDIECVPRLVDALEGIKIVDISCGEYHTAAVDEEGKLFTWGWGGSTLKGSGALGHAGGEDESIPRLVRTLVDQGVPIKSVECGELHTVALTKDGEIWAWGNGEYGRLGNGASDNFEVPEPIEYFADQNVASISAGRDFTFAITEHGEVYSWGINSHSQLGLGGGLTVDYYNMETIPVVVEALSNLNVTQVSAGYDHAAAVTKDGKMFMWGAKLWLEPHEMTILQDEEIISVKCGRYYTAALSSTGKLYTFGKGHSSCLGHGERKTLLQPAQIESLDRYNVVSVTCGYSHMGALTKPFAEAVDKDFSFRT
ncbi:unnamed protein product [Albugo candida]|uniref:RCC1-like domain-containing protein n=1 Tax=Albugo candida TaxID=65357 RepID=A0A024FZZ1_9STRA|nr:unnamed protein product [Albugo candida]|eukprot:CCI39952.1 unnamed protein product [Albugo candida]